MAKIAAPQNHGRGRRSADRRACAVGAEGYRSLSGLVSHAHLVGSKGAPRLALDALARYVVGLECLTGCRQGTVTRAILDGDERAARAALDLLCDIIGRGHVWVEGQRYGIVVLRPV